MRRILHISIFLTLLIFICSKNAYAKWEKNPNNPIFKAIPSSWESKDANSATVLYENNIYKMWYHGSEGNLYQIGYAESADGINWTRNPSNPILIPQNETGFGETDVEEPVVIKVGNEYKMWFNSYDDNNRKYRIRLATSSGGLHWTKLPGAVLTGVLSWEDAGITNPHVLYKDGVYRMWYMAAGSTSVWKIGYAESTDGIHWQKYAQNPLNIPTIIYTSSPTVIFYQDKFHMWYGVGSSTNSYIWHAISDDGIHWQCEGECEVIRQDQNGFDDVMLGGAEVKEINGNLIMWYGGTSFQWIWQIGMASYISEIAPKKPLVLVPGLFASWNKEALLHNQVVGISDWKINPEVKDYSGLIQTLVNLGYVENKDYYVFAYDWRKPLNTIADNLNTFLQQTVIPNHVEKIQLVGHSLGGLVSRIYAQKHQTSSIDKVITLGSPHQGAAQTYKVVEAGEIDEENSWQWLAEKMILTLNKQSFETDRQTIQRVFPIANDLFPTFSFLKNNQNTFIGINSLFIKNNTLNIYNQTIDTLNPYLTTIYGERGNTAAGYVITNRTTIDQLLDLYPDGHPTSLFFNIGDTVVLSQSAKAGTSFVSINLDHGELVRKSQGIQSILANLSIPYQNSQIQEGVSTTIFPSLIFLMLSPALMNVTHEGTTYPEYEGLIFIENASSGSYVVNARGIEKGRYTILIGQIAQGKTRWSFLEGEIRNDNPSTQIDTYAIDFNTAIPKENPANENNPDLLFEELIIYLTDINKTLKNNKISKAIISLTLAKTFYANKKYPHVKTNLLATHQYISAVYQKLNGEDKRRMMYALDKLENIYDKTLTSYVFGVFPARIRKDINKYKEMSKTVKTLFLTLKKKGKNVLVNTQILLIVDEKLKTAEENLNKGNSNYAEILVKSVSEYMKNIRN